MDVDVDVWMDRKGRFMKFEFVGDMKASALCFTDMMVKQRITESTQHGNDRGANNNDDGGDDGFVDVHCLVGNCRFSLFVVKSMIIYIYIYMVISCADEVI